MKILYVTKALQQKEKDGGLAVSIRNFNILQELYGKDSVKVFEISRPNIFTRIKNILFLQSYAQTIKNYRNFKKLLKSENFDFIFFNGSLYNIFVRYSVKNNIRSFVFFHNIESLYYKSMYENKKTFFTWLFSRYIKFIETQTVKNASYCINISSRDSNELEKVYNRKSDFLMPISMPCSVHKKNETKQTYKTFCLFLGSNFYANQHGISWFIENVLPFINIEFHIAGSISNYVREKFQNLPNTVIEGYVDDIESIYEKASFIVSPIFLGSGMKTKTIEALSFGKSIIGTTEAFIGIDGDLEKLGGLANDSETFIKKINEIDCSTRINKYSCELFRNNFCDDVIKENLKNFLCKKIILSEARK